jgi:curved DNA-binding protein CbpA
MASDPAPTAIEALARIIDELDYYELLHVKRDASTSEVRKAYYFSSRTFHPDVNRHLSEDLQTNIAKIAKRITEAYSVLRDPRRNKAYLQCLENGTANRMQLAEAEAAADRQASENKGRTPQGRQYYNLAEADLRRKDYPAAIRNLQTAITFEPDNEFFKSQLKDARANL